ncbi:hypothetical protein [Zobellia sp. B3R18]|uniref:hypothetical protein n=1 Tax=Zobellia sp. B3R18 TaxID=2841568 RepID=UPI001C077518|nr:hypothetical protein [Zobellia sp. B3R18]MBU2976387.1 hypothetical protein [Zobellia sp. B3R18]
MKQYVVLFVTFVMMVKPLWPVAEYIANYDYIVNVLCENKDKPMLNCDGKCYLAKQLAKESEKNSKNPFGEKQSKVEIQTVVFFQSLLQIDFGVDTFYTPQGNYKTESNLISLLLTSDIAQPPELA